MMVMAKISSPVRNAIAVLLYFIGQTRVMKFYHHMCFALTWRGGLRAISNDCANQKAHTPKGFMI